MRPNIIYLKGREHAAERKKQLWPVHMVHLYKKSLYQTYIIDMYFLQRVFQCKWQVVQNKLFYKLEKINLHSRAEQFAGQ